MMRTKKTVMWIALQILLFPTCSIMSYSACIIGSTGAVGTALTNELLSSTSCRSITALNRRVVDTFATHPNHSKLSQHVVDFDNLDTPETRGLLGGCEVAFNTLGVGRPSRASTEDLYRIDVTYARDFAKLCKAVGVTHMSLLGAVGPSKTSWIAYSRFKAEAEQSLVDEGFKRTSLYRPSAMITKENRFGLVDVFNHHVFPILSMVLPAKYHEIKVEDLAKAMRVNVELNLEQDRAEESKKVDYLEYKDFMDLVARGN
jgi:uncharacterized protein YbjT (DUF2867 family)